MTDPLGYVEFLHLNVHARMILTVSGGPQEEATGLGVPCITLRSNTERPITCEVGTNYVVGTDPGKIHHHVSRILRGDAARGRIPDKWDGRAAERIVAVLSTLA